MKARRLLGILLSTLWIGACTHAPIAPRTTGPWDPSLLRHAPEVTHGSRTGRVEALHYAGAPYQGRPTRVFAYLGKPDNPGPARHPGILLVHGGGGKAFREWADHWAERGYVALAMDLSGNGPEGRLPDGMPDQSDATKFRDFTRDDVREMWTYHAVAAVLRGHALLKSMPEVDARRIGVTGISWGGYLTCIVAGIDPELRVAVPVYGCGFLGDNSVWTHGALAAMTPEARSLWLREFDPSRYLAGVRCPTLFLNGTTDFAYPLDSYQKSYRLVPDPWRHLSVVVGLPHGHIWTFPEVDAFVDDALAGRSRARLTLPEVSADRLTSRLSRPIPVRSAQLHYTTDGGPWQKRTWRSLPGEGQAGVISAPLPTERPLVAFLAVVDGDGLRISSEHVTLGR